MNYMELVCYTEAKDISCRKVRKKKQVRLNFSEGFELILDDKQGQKIRDLLCEQYGNPE